MYAKLLEKFIKTKVETGVVKLPYDLAWKKIIIEKEYADYQCCYFNSKNYKKTSTSEEEIFAAYFVEKDKVLDYLEKTIYFGKDHYDSLPSIYLKGKGDWIRNFESFFFEKIFTKPKKLPYIFSFFDDRLYILDLIASEIGVKKFYERFLNELEGNASYFIISPKIYYDKKIKKTVNAANLQQYDLENFYVYIERITLLSAQTRHKERFQTSVQIALAKKAVAKSAEFKE